MMNYLPDRTERFKKDYQSLVRKNMGFKKQIDKKLNQILDDPHVYKSLRKPLAGYKRVQVGSYVITFRIEREYVIFTRLAHHDEIYGLFHE